MSLRGAVVLCSRGVAVSHCSGDGVGRLCHWHFCFFLSFFDCCCSWSSGCCPYISRCCDFDWQFSLVSSIAIADNSDLSSNSDCTVAIFND